MDEQRDILILTNVSLGERAKFIRLSKGLRQIDLAAQAKVNPMDITNLEHNRYVLPTRRKRILAVLGLDDDSESK
jgi:transcriptional regulator with XRE-family HTH domain